MFSGSFSTLNFAEVANLLSGSAQTGALRITQQLPLGSVYFWQGQLVHAENGSLTGLDALGALASYFSADFNFDADVPPPGQTLVAYSTKDLIENIRQQIEEVGAMAAAMPGASDVVKYIPGKSVSGLHGTPTELALLLLANGTRTVSDVAREAQMDVEAVRFAFARFKRAGVLDSFPTGAPPASVFAAAPRPAPVAPAAPPSAAPAARPSAPPVPSAPPPAAPAPDANGTTPVYWRGRRIN
jgi:hypothetical protein